MQIKIRAAVIDDEPIAREGIKSYLQKIDYIESISVFSEPLKALKKITAGEFDVLFLDIKMPGINGMELLGSLEAPPEVIIITAYPGYAVQGFELDASGYLVKPVSFEKFLKSVNKVRSRILLKRSQDTPKQKNSEEYFFIKNNRSYYRINFDDILFIEAMQNYAAIHTKDKKHIAYGSMNSIYRSLPEGRFLRIQKSYIVQISQIESTDGNFINIGKTKIPVGRNKKAEILKIITGEK